MPDSVATVTAVLLCIMILLISYPELPFGDMKQSGIDRELGINALADYKEQKTIQLHIGTSKNY